MIMLRATVAIVHAVSFNRIARTVGKSSQSHICLRFAVSIDFMKRLAAGVVSYPRVNYSKTLGPSRAPTN